MEVIWVIENIAKEESFTELIDAVKRAGYPLIEIMGDYTSEMLDREKLSWKCVVFNGSINMVKLLKDRLLGMYCYPTIYCNFENYECTNYYSHFGKYLFNDKYAILSLSELNRRKLEIYGEYSKEALIFLRPSSGEKTFKAQLVDLQDFDRFYQNHQDLKHDLMIVSTPKNILWEGRFIVSDEKEIISHSTYKFKELITKIPAVPQGAINFAEKLLNEIDYFPDSVFCYDICQTYDNEFYLLELTSFSSAGLYASDKDKIVEKVSKIALRDNGIFQKWNPTFKPHE